MCSRSHEASVTVCRSVDAITKYIGRAVRRFERALRLARPLVVLDLTAVRDIDQRFFGLMLMLRKNLHRRGATLLIVGASGRVRRLFRLNELEFLLDDK